MALSKIETASLGVGQFGGRRNMLINGDCSVWQRGTSHTNGGLSYYSIDRWWTYNVNGTFQRSTEVPAGEGFAYSMNMAGTWNSLGQPIELPTQGVTMLKPNTDYCISFWVKGATTTTTPYVTHRYRDQKGSGAGNVNIDGGTTNYTITPEWQRIAIVFNTGTTVPAATNNILDIEFAGWGATQTNTYLTGFQLEEGSTPSPFEHTLAGEQLALCQRFFHQLGGGANKTIAHVYPPSGAELAFDITFPVTMRAIPSVSFSSANNLTYRYAGNSSQQFNRTSGSISTGQMTEAGGSPWFAGFTHSSNEPGEVRVTSGTVYMQFDAEV